MEGKTWGKLEMHKWDLKVRCHNFFIRWQKTSSEEKSKEGTKKLKDI